MQNDSSTSDSFPPTSAASATSVTADNGKSTPKVSPHLSRNPFLSPISLNQFDPNDFKLFPNSNSVLSMSPSGYSSFDEDVTTTDNRLHQDSIVLEYRQLYNRYTLCLAQLQETLKEVDALRGENEFLRRANADLVQRLSILSQATIQNCLLSSTQPALSLINDFNRLNVEGINHDTHVTEETSNISPTSVIEHNRFGRRNIERVSLPKSISVRSSGYLKMNRQEGSNGGPSSQGTSGRSVPRQSLSESQRVCVPGGKRMEEALEFEVYNQGMIKTELCNKWQETGACPYGENCQFAHGITELRPVIRHPRYKTEVCRMILAGDICPYGHRCHFRHSLTEQERLLAPRE